VKTMSSMFASTCVKINTMDSVLLMYYFSVKQ